MEEEYIDYEEKELNFTFKQMRKVALGDDISQYNFAKGDKLSLLCCSKLYGLVFLSKRSGFIVFPVDTLVKCHETNFSQPLNQVIPVQYSGIQIKAVELGASPFILSLNADDSILICIFRNAQNLITAAFYDVTNFALSDSPCQANAIFPLNKDPSLILTDFQWNPTKPDIFALCFSNGECLLFQFILPQNFRAFPPLNNLTTSICWSPKGKHLAIGTSEGNLEQYSCEKEPIQLVKKHPQISNLASLQTKVVHLKWLSTYLFVIVYSLLTDSGETDQILVLKHTKKGEKTVIVNFSDIYVQSDNSPTFYFSELFSQHRILITTTGLANEVFVLANQIELTNPREWFLAILDDTSRAEIPLEGVEETFPMGLAVDTTSRTPIPTDKEALPPHPILLLLTTKGVICPFHMIYEGMPSLIEPARQLKYTKQFNPSLLVKAQTGNSQDVPKNPSTTTVTVLGGNKPISTNSPTFILTSTQKQTDSPSQVAAPFTEPIPPKTLGPTPSGSTLSASIPPAQGNIFKTPAQPSAGLFGVPASIQPNISIVPKPNPPTTLQIPQTQLGGAKSSSPSQPAVFNISPDPNTTKPDQGPKQTTSQNKIPPIPQIQNLTSQMPKAVQSENETTKRIQGQNQVASNSAPIAPNLTAPKTQSTQPPNNIPAHQINPNMNIPPKTVNSEPQKQTVTIYAPTNPTIIRPNIPSQMAQNVPSQMAQNVPSQMAQNIPSQMAQNVPSQIAQNVPSQMAQNVPSQIAQNVPSQMAQNVPSQMAQNIPSQMAQNVPSQMAQSTHPQAKPMVMPSPISAPNTSQTKNISSQLQPMIPLSIPLTSQNEIEVRYETHIRNEIEDFSDDLEQLKSKLRTKFGDFDDTFQGKLKDLVGSVEEKNKMYRDTSKVRQELNSLIKAFDEMNQIISTIRNEGFHIQEKIEDANKAKKWISSAKFGFFIATTPLDPISEEKRKTLIQTYSILDQKLQEVEITLLTMLNRSSDTNEVQAIYTTIASQEKIVQNLIEKMDNLSEEIQEFKFNRQLSKINLSTTCINPYELLTKSLEKKHFSFKVQTNRIVELKDFLCHIPTAQIIKPRNPTNKLNISRSISQPRVKISPIPKLPVATDTQKPIQKEPSHPLIQPNTGFKLLCSPQGDLYVSPTPYTLPVGCVSVDTNQLNILTQNPLINEAKTSQATPPKEIVSTQPNIDEYTRTSMPKVIIEHKPQSDIKISPPKPTQTEEYQRDNPPKDQRVNRTLDFSTPQKHSTIQSDSATSTPIKPLEDSPPNINLFAGNVSHLGPGPLESLPDYSSTSGQLNPIILPSPGATVKIPSATIEHFPKPQNPSNDPRLKQNPQSDGKLSQDKTLFNLLSTHDGSNLSAPPQAPGKDKSKSVNIFNATPKQPSTLLQSTNPESKTSPAKVTDVNTGNVGSEPVKEKSPEKPKSAEKSQNPDNTEPISSSSKSSSDLVGQTLNIPQSSNLLQQKPGVPSTTDQTSTPNVPPMTTSQIKLSAKSTNQFIVPDEKHTLPSIQPGDQAKTTIGQSNLPNSQISMPTSQTSSQTGQLNLLSGQSNMPKSQMPSFQMNLPQRDSQNAPIQHPTLPLIQNQSQIGTQAGKENPKQFINVPLDGDSEMQDDAEEGEIQPQQLFQGASFGIGTKSSTQPMNNNPNPFGLSTGGPSGASNPFSGGGQNIFNLNPQNPPANPAVGQSHSSQSIFGNSQPNFGAGASLFQGPGILQGISPQKSDPMGFGRSSGGATFGSIASSSQSAFGLSGNPIGQPGFNQQSGPNVFVDPGLTSMSGQGNEMKGKAFTAYRS